MLRGVFKTTLNWLVSANYEIYLMEKVFDLDCFRLLSETRKKKFILESIYNRNIVVYFEARMHESVSNGGFSSETQAHWTNVTSNLVLKASKQITTDIIARGIKWKRKN